MDRSRATRHASSSATPTLTVYLRRANRLSNPDLKRVTMVEGDVLDRPTLEAAMGGQGVVYASLAGAMKQQAETIVAATHATGLERLIFISSMGSMARSRARSTAASWIRTATRRP